MIPFTSLARQRTATEGGTQLSLLMHLDAVVNAFCLSGNLVNFSLQDYLIPLYASFHHRHRKYN